MAKIKRLKTETKTPAGLRVPEPVEQLVYEYVPRAGMSLSRSREERSKSRLQRACPSTMRADFDAERKRWVCPMHPLYPPQRVPGDVRCCLPSVLETPKDIERVWDAIRDPDGGFGVYEILLNEKGSSGKNLRMYLSLGKPIAPPLQMEQFEEFQSRILSGEISQLRFGYQANRWATWKVFYKQDPITGLLHLVWPDPQQDPERLAYLGYLIGSALVDDWVLDELQLHADYLSDYPTQAELLHNVAVEAERDAVAAYLLESFGHSW